MKIQVEKHILKHYNINICFCIGNNCEISKYSVRWIMGTIIWIAVVIYIIVRVVNSQKKVEKPEPAQPKRKKPKPQKYQQPDQQHVQPEYRQPERKDILSRAAANVMENQQDKLELEMKAGKKADDSMIGAYRSADRMAAESTGELMKTVENLIVMGYHPDLTFERDFIAEGIEMLNQFEIPDTL